MRYKMTGGAIVDTDRSAQSWQEASDWNGRNLISRATGEQFTHETLYRSQKGNYYVVHESDYQGTRATAEWISNNEAVAWLLLNDHPVPDDLDSAAKEIME